jgi:ATP-dependent Clp protease ATP-binding subunit ClpA
VRCKAVQYTSDALESIRNAKEAASRHGSMFADCEHLLLGLLSMPGSVAGNLLNESGLQV